MIATPSATAGQYYDSETETYYLRARYYNPRNGRFTTEDTHWNIGNMIYGDDPKRMNERTDSVGLPLYTYVPDIQAIRQSGNLYVYGNNNPVLFIDPTGESLSLIFALGIIAAVGALLTSCSSSSSSSFQKNLKYNKIQASDITFSDKFSKPGYSNQVATRGWTLELIAYVMNNPYKIGVSVNTYTGNSVTLYYYDDVHYVAVDDKTGKVIQVSDREDSGWESSNLTK